MRLVYLDTSHYSRLGRLVRHQPSRFTKFVQHCRSRDLTIAFSRTHLMEFLQHADAKERLWRYRAMQQLLPITTDILTREIPQVWPLLLVDREIVTALVTRQRVVVSDGGEEWLRVHTSIFPYVMELASDVVALTVFESAPFPLMSSMVRDAIETSTRANTRPANMRLTRSRLDSLSDAPLSPVDVGEQVRQLVEATERELAGKPNMNTDSGRKALDQVLKGPIEMLRRAGEVGMRRAYAEAMGVESSREINRQTVDEISRDYVFASSVRRVAEQSLGVVDPAVIENLSKNVKLPMCPGTWLSREVEAEIRNAEPNPQPSNTFDVDHVSYLPYVDFFFTDRRIATYVNQVLRRGNLPAQISAKGAPIAVDDSIEDLTYALS